MTLGKGEGLFCHFPFITHPFFPSLSLSLSLSLFLHSAFHPFISTSLFLFLCLSLSEDSRGRMLYTAGVGIAAVLVAVCQYPALSTTCEAKFAEANRAAAQYAPWQVCIRPRERERERDGKESGKRAFLYPLPSLSCTRTVYGLLHIHTYAHCVSPSLWEYRKGGYNVLCGVFR